MTPLEVTCTVAVAADPQRVWSFVVEDYLDHHHLWDPAIAQMHALTEGPLRAGAVGEEVRRLGPRTQRTRFEVDTFEPPRRFAFHDVDGPFDLHRSYGLSAPGPGTGSGTTLTFRFLMAPRGATRLIFPLLRGPVGRQVRANIERIPGLVT